MLVHVVHLPTALTAPVTGSEVSFVTADARPHVEQAKAHLRELADQLVPPGLIEKLVVHVGVPYHEIVEAAGELQADLLAITTHGHTGLKHVLLGSTAEWTVRHAPCPVLTVRRRDGSRRQRTKHTDWRFP